MDRRSEKDPSWCYPRLRLSKFLCYRLFKVFLGAQVAQSREIVATE